MPSYPYSCEKCDKEFDVIKPMSESSRPETCPTCGNPADRVFTCNVHFYGTKIEDAEYNPGLGCVTKSKKHREEIAKRIGAIEIGNECPTKIDKHFEKQREEKRLKSWEKIDNEL